MSAAAKLTDEEVVEKVWSAYGIQDPYFSVITNDKFHAGNITKHETEFWETGKDSIAILKKLYKEYHAHAIIKNPRVLDYGCGVGRLMKAWGVGCEGCDISPGHLEITREKLGPEYPTHLVKPGECPRGFDVIFSLLVLQHNRPELMKKCMKSIIEALNHDGLAMIHAPYYIKHISRSDEVMEMNFVPRNEMVPVIEEAGGKVIQYNHDHDMCGGGIQNCIYVIRKVKAI